MEATLERRLCAWAASPKSCHKYDTEDTKMLLLTDGLILVMRQP